MEIAQIRKDTGYLFKTCSVLCERYGPVVGLKIGSDRIVILNDYDSVCSMLLNPDCEGRPTGLMYKARTWGKRRGENYLFIHRVKYSYIYICFILFLINVSFIRSYPC